MSKRLEVTVAGSGAYKVEVIENGTLLWQFLPSNNGSKISFCDFFSGNRFAVLDWDGNLWLCDAARKEVYHTQRFHSDISGCGAAVSIDGKKLFVTSFNMGDRLNIFNLETLEVVKALRLPGEVESETFWVDSKGRLLFYTDEGEYGDDQWSHGMFRLNPDTEESEAFTFSAPPPCSFDKKPPVFSFEHNVGIRWYYDIEIITTDEAPQFVHKVAVFDAETFEDMHVISTREFKPAHLGYGLKDTGESEEANILMNKEKDGEEYYDKLNDFVNDLYSVYICRNAPEFWVCFRGGILRKIALDGSRRSALVALEKVPHNSVIDPFFRKYFHTRISPEVSTDDKIVFGMNPESLFVLKPAEKDLDDEDGLVLIPPVPFTSRKVEMSDEQKQEASDLGINVVPIADTESDEAISEALDRLVALFDDIDSLRSAYSLRFKFRTPDGRELDEEAFFQRAVQVPGGPSKLETILRKFIDYEEHEELYYDEEMVALGYALAALVLSDEKYVDLYTEYWRHLDTEHDVYNQETLLPNVLSTYKWSPRLLRLLGVILPRTGFDYLDIVAKDENLLAYLEEDTHLRILIGTLQEKCEYFDDSLDSWKDSNNPIERAIASRYTKVMGEGLMRGANAAQMLQNAVQIGLSGNWSEAAEILSEAADLDPYNVEVLNMYGYSLAATNNSKAETVLKKVLDLDSNNIHALSNLAVWYYRTGDIKQGQESYRRLFAARVPIDTLYHLYLSDLQSADFDAVEQARSDFLEMAKVNDPGFESRAGKFAHISNSRARIINAVNMDKHEEVVEEAEGYVGAVRELYSDRSPEVSEALYHLGMVYEGTGQFGKAIEVYRQGAEIDQAGVGFETVNWAGAALKHNSIAECCRKSGDLSTCREYYKIAIDQGTTAWGKDHPNLSVFYGNRAVYEMQTGFPDQAQEFFSRAFEIQRKSLPDDHPSRSVLLNNFGRLCLEQGRNEDARAMFEQAIRIDSKVYGDKHPKTAVARLNLAATREAMGILDSAYRTAGEAREILIEAYGETHIETVPAYRTYGLILLKNGEIEKAVAELKRAVEITESFYGENNSAAAEAKADLGYALLGVPLPDEAVPILEQAERLFSTSIGMQHPRILEILKNLGHARLLQDDIVGAAKALTQLAHTAAQQKRYDVAYDAYITIAVVYIQAGLSTESEKFLDSASEAKSRAEVPVKAIENNDLVLQTIDSLVGGGRQKEAFQFYSAVLSLAAAQEDGDLVELSERYRKQIDPDHIEYALSDDEVFAMSAATLKYIYVYTVTSEKGLKTLTDISRDDFNLSEFIERKRPGKKLVSVADMLERTTAKIRENQEIAAEEHARKAASYKEACAKIQAEMQERINAAIAEGRYEDVAAITTEMTEKLTKLGNQFG